MEHAYMFLVFAACPLQSTIYIKQFPLYMNQTSFAGRNFDFVMQMCLATPLKFLCLAIGEVALSVPQSCQDQFQLCQFIAAPFFPLCSLQISSIDVAGSNSLFNQSCSLMQSLNLFVSFVSTLSCDQQLSNSLRM